MANPVSSRPESLKRPEWCPHSVKIRADTHPWPEIRAWLHDRNHTGAYRFDEGIFHDVFYFSEENTAFEFKVRFG